MQVVSWLNGVDFDYMESFYRCRIRVSNSDDEDVVYNSPSLRSRRKFPIRGGLKIISSKNQAKVTSNQIWYLHSSLSQPWQDLYLFSYNLEIYMPSAWYYEHESREHMQIYYVCLHYSNAHRWLLYLIIHKTVEKLSELANSSTCRAERFTSLRFMHVSSSPCGRKYPKRSAGHGMFTQNCTGLVNV